MSEYSNPSEDTGFSVTNEDSTVKYSFLYLRDENGTSDGYILRLKVSDGTTAYTKDYKILCKDDPYSPLVYVALGELENITLYDNGLNDNVDVRLMKVHEHSGGRDNSKGVSKTAWLLFADASNDLCYYLSDDAASRSSFLDYDKYQANDDYRFGYEWGYNKEYPIRSNISATSSKDMNNKILFYISSSGGPAENPNGYNVFKASDGSKNKTMWEALIEFRNRFASGSDRYSIPNHRTMMYIHKFF